MKQAERDGFIVQAGREPLILSIDTSTETSSVAVVRGACVLSLRAGDPSVQHSSSLLAEVDAALLDAKAAIEDIDLFAVAVGPGSFTGLRAGLATVKAFAATLGRPVVGVPTLHAVACAGGTSAARIVAAIPAGRGELFAQLLRVEQGAVVELDKPAHVAPERLLDRAVELGAGIKWTGGGAIKIADLIRERAARESITVSVETESSTSDFEDGGWTLASPANVLAAHIASLARADFEQGRATRAENLQAIYVRPSDAELNEKCHTPYSSPK